VTDVTSPGQVGWTRRRCPSAIFVQVGDEEIDRFVVSGQDTNRIDSGGC